MPEEIEMVRKFTDNGREYSDAPAGWLKAQKDAQNDKLTEAGHRMVWKKDAKTSYSGDCRNCNGNVVVGVMSTSTCQFDDHGRDIRHNRCQP